MKLTVFGATGGTGQHVVRQALDAGHKVIAVVRDPSRLDLEHPRLEVATVPELTDPEPLIPALKGSDAAISCIGPRDSKSTGIVSAATRVILHAMTSAEVRRFVVISAVPVGPTPEGDSWTNRYLALPIIRLLLRKAYADLAEMEDDVRRSTTDWTVVRPPRLLDAPLTGSYRMVVGGNVPRSTSIGRANLAHAMLAVLDNPATIRQAVGVGS